MVPSHPFESPLIHLPEGPAHPRVWRRRGPAPTLPHPQTPSLSGRSGLPGQLEGECAIPDLGQSHIKGETGRALRGHVAASRGGGESGVGSWQGSVLTCTRPWGCRTPGRAGRWPAAQGAPGSRSASQVFSRGADHPSPVPSHPGGRRGRLEAGVQWLQELPPSVESSAMSICLSQQR